MSTDYRALCAELIDAMASTGEAASGTYSALLIRAHEALAKPQPEVVEPTDKELADTYWDAWHKHLDRTNSVLHAVGLRAVLARWGRSVPTPAEGEVAWLIEFLRNFGDELMNEHGGVAEHNLLASAADLLEQHNPAPVPVSERLPGAEDCDAEGRCWLFSKVEKEWRLIDAGNPGVPHLKYCFSHWLPATALPLPQGEIKK